MLYLFISTHMKSIEMKKIAFTLLSVALLSCGAKKESNKGADKINKGQENIITAQSRIGDFSKENDPLTIDTVYMQGNQLFIDVTYGGGCQDHTFEVIGSPMIAKSYPAQRAIQLVHHANGDLCKALVKKTIQVDASNLTDNQKDGNVIHYNLDGYKPRIEHTYLKATKPKR